jgi:hypothetical protein
MPRRPFTVAEVEGLIPALERIFFNVLQLRSAMRVHEEALERAGVSMSREALEADNPRDKPDLRRHKAFFRGYYQSLGEELARVGELGGVVKDLESGLVDFPGRRGEEDILLCWKLGEKTIEFWHTAEAGFAGRRPIDDQVPREPNRLD